MPIARWAVLSMNGEESWCGRRKHQVVSHRGSLYLLGGYTSAGVLGVGSGPDANLNDVWKSTEGMAWVRLLERATWSGRDGHTALVHNGAIYLMGGTQDPRSNFNDVWRSVNGRDWVLGVFQFYHVLGTSIIMRPRLDPWGVCRHAAWRGRWQHAALSYQGHIYIVGGWTEGHGCLGDTWRSVDGIRWQKMCDDAPWGGRMFHSVIAANGAMYLLGGSNGREKLNDVWVSTDGREWNLVTHQSQWSPRAGHACICFENALYVIGGDGIDGKLSDVWRSDDGAHWTQTEANVTPPRQGHAAVVHRGKVLVFGGVSEGTVFLNDCLSALSAEDIIRRGLNFSRNESRPSRDAAVPPLSPVNTSTPAATNGVMPASGGLVTEILASNSNATAAPTAAAGGDVNLARRISRSSRHQSVEDELWGWFGDDRPLSEVGDSRSLAATGVGGGYYSSTDRLFSRVSSGGRIGRAAGVSLLEDGGGNRGDAAEVTVSTTALTERLAKLSAGRALLDHVRAESRALADLVSSAARRALSGDGEGENVAAATAALAVAAASEGTAIVRRVSISLPPVTVMPRSTAVREPAEAEAGESAVEEQVIAVAEQGHSPPVSLSPRRLSSNGHPGGACGQTVSAEEQRGAVIRTEDGREQGLEGVAEEPARLIESVAQSPGGEEDARPCSSEQEVGVHVEREQQKTPHEDVGEEGGIVFAQAIRQRVVDARAELERLQRDIRRLAREGEAAREKVTPLVDRRAELAKAAITDARLVAQRLQEVADAQRSNHSNIVAAMRKVEERARAAGGRVWRLIRDRSRQRGNDGGGSEEDEGSSDGDSDEGSRPTQENGGHGVGASNMPRPAVPSRPPDGRSRPAAVQPPEWVQARLDLMLHRGSFIDGDELGQQRDAAGSVSSAQVASGGGGEGLSAESAAESFASLAQKAVGDGVGGERGETDRGLSAVQADMYAHAAALSRLAGWMAQAVPATGSGGGDSASQIALTPTSQRPSASGGARGASLSSEASSPSALAIFSPSAMAGFNPEPIAEAAQVESGPHAAPAASMAADGLAPNKTVLSGSSGDSRANSVVAAMRLSRELDDLEASVKRERFTAHRAAEEEIYRIPELYKEACALGNALILRGHDYLSQVLAEVGRESSEASIRAEDAGAWALRVERLADGEGLAAKADALRRKIADLNDSVLEKEDAAIDCRSALEKRRRRMAPAEELEPLQVALAAAERGVRRAKREGRKAAAEAASLVHGACPEVALDLPQALDPMIGKLEEVQGVNVARVPLPVRSLSDYENLRPMEDDWTSGGGQGRHRIFLAEYDEETVVLKGYALVNALQRHSLERELVILHRIRHGAIIRAVAIVRVRDDGTAENPVPMIYVEFPYCAQGNLRHWLKAEPRKPWELQAAFRQVMCAVMHLHDRGVIHKDIKPGNVLVHADGRFLLADFDVSKDTLGAASGSPQEAGPGLGPASSPCTASGIGNGKHSAGGGGENGMAEQGGVSGPGDGSAIVPGFAGGGGDVCGMSEAMTTRTSVAGTQGFMAPEVEAGRPSTLASDMYSLGALLFHMHFPDHPTGPLPVGDGNVGSGGAGGASVGVPLVLPRATDLATTSLLKALLAADPAKRPTAPDALQADYFRVSHVERLQEDGSLLEQTRKLEAVRALFRSVRDEAKSAGPLKWTVQRDSRYLVPTVLELVKTEAKGAALRRALKITFKGEAGVDEGGILSEMYTLLFEAMMLPRFGLFEHSESPPAAPTTTSSSSSPDDLDDPDGGNRDNTTATPSARRRRQDPTERAFSARYRGVTQEPRADQVGGGSGASGSTSGSAGTGSAGSSGSTGGGSGGIGRITGSGNDALIAQYEAGGAGLLDVSGSNDARQEHGPEADDDAEEYEEGDEEAEFQAQREAQRLIVESAAGGAGGSGAGPNGRVMAGAKFLPTARPGGYTDAQLSRYRAVGRTMVKCLFEGRRMGSRLSPSVFKFLTGTQPTLRDLQDYDPAAFDGLKWVLANTVPRDMFHFEEVGQPEKGPVTEANKAEYVAARARLILVGSREPALEALKGGFAGGLRDLSPGAAPFMGLLSHADWRVLLCGEEHVSGPQVVAVLTWYNFPRSSKIPEWIKSMLLSLPEDALRRFLIFVCGTPSLPAASAEKVEITVRCQPRSAALPAAHTCFFQLDVPDYDKKAVLEHKLLQAVNNTASFDVV